MHAEDLAEDFPVVSIDSDSLAAARLLAERRLPGIVVCDTDGQPHTVLPGSQVVRFLVPGYIQDDPSLAGVLSESLADRIADELGGVTVRALLGDEKRELARVNADDTVLEVAAVMARLHSPLVAVIDGTRLVGVITASRLLEAALSR
ncbi:MAG: CBS domain-containing protein [Thermocrispum sp.]